MFNVKHVKHAKSANYYRIGGGISRSRISNRIGRFYGRFYCRSSENWPLHSQYMLRLKVTKMIMESCWSLDQVMFSR